MKNILGMTKHGTQTFLQLPTGQEDYITQMTEEI